MDDRPRAARELWVLLEPVHAVVYFSAEPLETLRAAGCRGFWMGYFANRSAPLGPVGAGLGHALFYNFSTERVARALPGGWAFTTAAAALEAREHGSVAALRRQLGAAADGPEVGRAGELAARVAAAAPVEGRPLYPAHPALPT